MLYRLRRARDLRRFDRRIAGILATPPLTMTSAPLCIVSMVALADVPMYLLAIKALYTKLDGGSVVVIMLRNTPQSVRDTLVHHIPALEIVHLEDIDPTPLQRGGTWERLAYILERSETEYVMQMDADILAVGTDLDEIVACVRANRAFTIADGFARMTLPEAAAMAQATPSNYIGIAAEAAFDRYPGADTQHYIRGSSGFTGFAKGGYTRAQIAVFHREMEALVGRDRWREWGSEQCGSNFAIANSPDPVVLPYPDYTSFNPHAARNGVKLFHFIGRFRFAQGYFARRAQEVIARLTQGATPVPPPAARTTSLKPTDGLPFEFARRLTRDSLPNYLAWRFTGAAKPLTLEIAERHEFQDHPGPGPKLQIRPKTPASPGIDDIAEASDVFRRLMLFPPVWIPPERVLCIVDLGARMGFSSLWWLKHYWRAHITAIEPDPAHAAQARANVALNGYNDRFLLPLPTADLLAQLPNRHIDILKLDLATAPTIVDDDRFPHLDLGVIVLQWHDHPARDRSRTRLEALGYRTHTTLDDGTHGILWAYRDSPWGKFSLEPTLATAA
ncbi:MAG: hypothetical protein NVSMB18_12570 [Acetobacteraceae bacterium]